MTTWVVETGRYLSRLEVALAQTENVPPHPEEIPHPPLDYSPNALQVIIHRSVVFYEMGAWIRTRETIEAILCLWREGYLSSAASLVRLLFEIWGACHRMSEEIETYKSEGDLLQFFKIVSKLCEGVRSDVLMPWGTPASETPVHVMETIRRLKSVYPRAEDVYADLCESAHANQPRYFQWQVMGRLGDNWTNPTVLKRGHELLERTVTSIERCVEGIVAEISRGLAACGELYEK